MSQTVIKMNDSESSTVLDRLRRVKHLAHQAGWTVREEVLSGAAATWCELRGQRILFLDASQSAAEQILAIREVIEAHRQVRPTTLGRLGKRAG